MFKFEKVTLRDIQGDGEQSQRIIEVSGPLDGDPDRVKHIIFIIGQGDVSADAHANPGWTAEGWDGQVSAEGFEPGPAQAVGVAVNITAGRSPSYETFTWAQQIKIEA